MSPVFHYLRKVLEIKDYYSILDLSPSATGEEIKKAYRRLAHLYHPDKQANDLYASARFAEIKEAYETLSNPVRKDHYLQQRWFAQSSGQRIGTEIISPVTILKKMLDLDRYVSKLDVHRIHYESLNQHLHHILSDENIETINSFHEYHVNEEIIGSALKAAHGLPFRFIYPLANRLKKLSVKNEKVNEKIDHFTRYHERMHNWEKKKIWIILLVVLLICMIIFFSNK